MRGNSITTFIFVVLMLVALLSVLTKAFVGSRQGKVAVHSSVNTQKKIQDYLTLVARDKTAFAKTLAQNPQLSICARTCLKPDRYCAKETDICSPPPAGNDAAAIENYPKIELRDAHDIPLSWPDGSLYLNSDLKPCSLLPRPGVEKATEDCQWRVETRAYVNEESRFNFAYRILHESPLKKGLVSLASTDFTVNTELPRVFAFKRFVAAGHLDRSRDLIVTVKSDGLTSAETLIRCSNRDRERKISEVTVFAEGCTSSLFGPEHFSGLEGSTTGRVEIEPNNPCRVHLQINQEQATCNLEITAKQGQFSYAALEATPGSARMDNLSIAVLDGTKGEEALCSFRNGGKIFPAANGLESVELNLCNCAKTACFEKEGTIRMNDVAPFQGGRDFQPVAGGELWIELRNADAAVGASQISIGRPVE
jgi:hypothetical protein